MKNGISKLTFGGVAALVVIAILVGDNPFRRFAWRDLGQAVLSLVYQETITPRQMDERYERKRFRIALVPGHDNELGGAQFHDSREADVNLRIAEEIAKLLQAEGHFQVYSVRDFVTGDYIEQIKQYFAENAAQINEEKEAKRREFEGYVATGEVALRQPPVSHNFAHPTAAFRLRGINAWANENRIDLTLHIHVNDVAGRRAGRTAPYNGFSIYIPEGQFPNARASRVLAETLLPQLQKVIPVSNLPGESGGIIEDQELIALGSYATRKGAAVLVEYGYIYEAPFWKAGIREVMARELALQTYAGIVSYFDDQLKVPETAILPYEFNEDLEYGAEGHNVLALQRALKEEGLYPPPGRNLNDCPITGVYRDCVRDAVANFQGRYKMPPVGTVGPATRAVLNERYAPPKTQFD
jgi:N-acetylmuramoyl-L-alanine amidase